MARASFAGIQSRTSAHRLPNWFANIWLCGCLLLSGCFGSQDVGRLAESLEAESLEARYDAAKQIEDCIEKGVDASVAVPSLAAALSDEDPKVRYRAAKSLAKLDDLAAPAVTELSAALVDKNNDARTRYYVAKSIYKLGDDRSQTQPELILALKDSNPDVVRYAAKSLGKIGPPAKDSIPKLRRIAKTNNAKIRTAAREAIEKIKASEPDEEASGGSPK